MTTRLTRKELYDLLWSEPMRTVAARFSISDVGFKKYCIKFDIPVPPRGYWAKREAGKPTIPQVRLPPRAPGMADEVSVGGRDGWWCRHSDAELMGPLPDPPTFEEPLEAVRHRARKLVGSVRVRKLSEGCHPAIRRLLDKDDELRKKQIASPIFASYYKPHFDSQIEQRRLRLINTLFLALARVGGKGFIQGDDANTVGVEIYARSVSLTLAVPHAPTRRSSSLEQKPEPAGLRLAILDGDGSRTERQAWGDEPDARLETKLGEIAAEMLVAAEEDYRANRMHQYEWRVKRKAQLEEAARQRIVEQERKARELKAKREQERIDGLLAQAAALRQARDIRAYVEEVRAETAASGQFTPEQTDKWAAWALAQADRIDPVKSSAFLQLRAETEDAPSGPQERD